MIDILEEEMDKKNPEVKRIVHLMFVNAGDPNGKYPCEPGEAKRKSAA